MTDLQRPSRLPSRPIAQYADDVEVINIPESTYGVREERGLLDYWYMLRRNRGTIVVALVGAFAGFLMTLSKPRIYQARTTLEVQGYNSDFLNLGSVTPTMADNRSSTKHLDWSPACLRVGASQLLQWCFKVLQLGRSALSHSFVMARDFRSPRSDEGCRPRVRRGPRLGEKRQHAQHRTVPSSVSQWLRGKP